MIDLEAIRKLIRTTYLEAEIVEFTASGELIGIRSGEYNALIHTRPADPAITPIVDADDLAVEGFPFDEDADNNLWWQETLLPSSDAYGASTIERVTGIYQMIVWTRKDARGNSETPNAYAGRYAKYFCEVFDARKPDLKTSQTGFQGMAFVSVVRSPAIVTDVGYGIPISIDFNAYKDNTVTDPA